MEKWHPDLLELELARTGEADEKVMLHLAECQDCQEQLRISRDFAENFELTEKVESSQEFDNANLAFIKERSKEIRESRRSVFIPFPILRKIAISAAAIILLSFIGIYHFIGLNSRNVAPVNNLQASAPLKNDFNKDGEVNILDAYLLSRKLDGEEDDETNVLMLARKAVSLEDPS